MPQTDSLISFTAILSTIALATKDVQSATKSINATSPFEAPLNTHTRVHLPPISAFQPSTLSSIIEPQVRSLTSFAFFYLAYRDHRRGRTHAAAADCDAGAAEWRARAWAGCGVAGMVMGPWGPYWRVLLKPLEERLRLRTRRGDLGFRLSDLEAERLVVRWSNVTLGRGLVLLATFPVVIKAFRGLIGVNQ